MRELAEIFKALGDPIRLEIVKLLLGKELCVCDILDSFNSVPADDLPSSQGAEIRRAGQR